MRTLGGIGVEDLHAATDSPRVTEEDILDHAGPGRCLLKVAGEGFTVGEDTHARLRIDGDLVPMLMPP